MKEEKKLEWKQLIISVLSLYYINHLNRIETLKNIHNITPLFLNSLLLIYEHLIYENSSSFFCVHIVWWCLSVVEMSSWAIVVWVTGVVSPEWLIIKLFIKLDVFFDHAVWTGFSIVEVGGWPIVVGISRIVSPSRFVWWFLMVSFLYCFYWCCW